MLLGEADIVEIGNVGGQAVGPYGQHALVAFAAHLGLAVGFHFLRVGVAFAIVGLPDKSVSEAKERVRAALQSMGLSLPPKRITVNLAPADVLKEGSHFDLPIALVLTQLLHGLTFGAFHSAAVATINLWFPGNIRARGQAL